MTNPKPIILFDLDGTLIDSAPDLVGTLNIILRRHGRTTLTISAVKKLVGNGARALLERGFKETGAPAENLDALTVEFIETYVPNCAVLSRPFSGVIETLDTFANSGYRMAVCTNKPQAPSETILTELGLMQYFEVVVGGDFFPMRKPDPQHLLGALQLMDAPENPAIMVGDSYNDVASARNAGIPVIVVTYGYTTTPAHELGGDILVDHFSDIVTAVARLHA
ncbi:MAG: phosphoglycolate phosphatase [Rhodospirillaceae bacterium]|jgi:phosphoglycolate phosphatase|nr:phosphoglycolate phosphatase [Rhodospirillaceae bacterium]